MIRSSKLALGERCEPLSALFLALCEADFWQVSAKIGAPVADSSQSLPVEAMYDIIHTRTESTGILIPLHEGQCYYQSGLLSATTL
jgi:hypothetical protein